MPTKPRYTPDELHSWGITTIPRHIAIIMDGNGRWAGKRDEVRTVGHRQVQVVFALWSKNAAGSASSNSSGTRWSFIAVNFHRDRLYLGYSAAGRV